MNLKILSLVALVGLAACVLGLYLNHALFGTGPVTIAIQVCAAALMIWARITFGIRSFHGAANPTAGGLVRTGPYKYIRGTSLAGQCGGGSAGVADVGGAYSCGRETAGSNVPGISRVCADNSASAPVFAVKFVHSLLVRLENTLRDHAVDALGPIH